MPTAPRRPCPSRGCPHLQPCPTHPPRLRWAPSDARSAHARGYTAAWRRLAASVLAHEPVCRTCRARPAVEVDHVIPKRDGGTDTWENLAPICRACHDTKTRADRRRGPTA